MIGIGLGFVRGGPTLTAQRDVYIKSGNSYTLSDVIRKHFDGAFIRNSITLGDAITTLVQIAHMKQTDSDSILITDTITTDLALA